MVTKQFFEMAVLISVDDASVMDCRSSKQKLILPIHITVIMFYLSHFYTVTCML